MKTTHKGRAAAIAFATAALAIAGCGSTGAKTSTSRTSHRSSPTVQASVGSYINSVTALEKPIENAASQFFHSPHAPAVELQRANALRDAYAKSAHQLSKITPPSVGVTAQRNLMDAWSGIAGHLAATLNRRPFSYSRAYSVAAAAEQPTYSAYSTILSLP